MPGLRVLLCPRKSPEAKNLRAFFLVRAFLVSCQLSVVTLSPYKENGSMKVVSIPAGMRRGIACAGDDEFASIDYTSPPRSARRRRRRSEEDVGNPSTIFPKAPTVQDYVSKRNPHGTEYVQQLIGRIDAGRHPHELDERRKEGAESGADMDVEAVEVTS